MSMEIGDIEPKVKKLYFDEFKGRVHEEDVFIPEDDHVRDEQVGLDQAPPGFIATPVLQDILARMLNFLEGMTQASILPSMYSGSQNRVGGQIPELQTTTVFNFH
ncbi:hypothetical protein HAX54_023945 [Datura stramonium]|uniref:Uncharacterized protein n=1 Tax=Datura stramonium TaxID=4076 RepID=A0ABS8UZ66_DATST|nr:hypothetical protein [Datura stramonium]